MKTVVVTGLGLMTPHGEVPDQVFAALMRGESAVRRVFPELPKPVAAATVAFDDTRWFTKLQLAGVDRVSQLAVAAAANAMNDAAIGNDVDRDRLGVYVGCGMGGATALDTAYRGAIAASGSARAMSTGLAGSFATARVPPLTIPAFMPNAPAAHVAMRHQAHGPVLTYSVACAASAVAIAEAAKAVASGEVDLAIAGGAEAIIVPGVMLAWQAMHTLATFDADDADAAAKAVRPFAADRSGFALGEGATFMILESEERARSRGARIYATLKGWGYGSDATHLTKPDVAGQSRALRNALNRAGARPADIGYCNAHGTATRIGDIVESDALAMVWGDDLDTLRVSSTKALHGHMLGGAGALEAAITVLALHHRQLPPNAHCSEIDPACRLILVPPDGMAAPDLQMAISNSFAFGGTNAVLVFARA